MTEHFQISNIKGRSNLRKQTLIQLLLLTSRIYCGQQWTLKDVTESHQVLLSLCPGSGMPGLEYKGFLCTAAQISLPAMLMSY